MNVFRTIVDRLFIKQPKLRSALTAALYGHSDREVRLFGSVFLVNSLLENGYVRAAHKASASSLLEDEVSVLLSLASILADGDTFVDVGANVGVFSRTLDRFNIFLKRPAVRIYAYEPHPDTFQRLQFNLSGTSAVARNVAASDRGGEMEFVEGAVSNVFTLATRASSYNVRSKRRCVSCVRLDEESVNGNSIVMKIDVEQQELAVLNGARNWFESGRVKAVYLDNYSDAESVDAFLRRFEFTMYNGRFVELPFHSGFSALALKQR